MRKGLACITIALAALAARVSQYRAAAGGPAKDAAHQHHLRGGECRVTRCLDDASHQYRPARQLDPAREASAEQTALARRFLPRLFTTPSEPFRLQDFAVILHPDRRLIAFHLFWEDDIDFPEDNDPCDHEVLWVEYADDLRTVSGISTYFHGRILRGGFEAIQEANAHDGRPRINVPWGKP